MPPLQLEKNRICHVRIHGYYRVIIQDFSAKLLRIAKNACIKKFINRIRILFLLFILTDYNGVRDLCLRWNYRFFRLNRGNDFVCDRFLLNFANKIVKNNMGILLLGHVELHISDFFSIDPLNFENKCLLVLAFARFENLNNLKLCLHDD